jgi:uncharacterized protein (TIGR03435 family)
MHVVGLSTVLLLPHMSAGQAARPTFEVASIKENRSGEVRTSSQPYPNGRLVLENNTFRQMIRQAYGLWDYQVEGGPDWQERTHYDVVAKAEKPATRPELMLMLQSLLEERFHLQFHRESRELPIYALERADPNKLGPSLKPAAPDDAKGRLFPIRNATGGGLEGTAATMSDLASQLSNLLGRLVVDKTNLDGAYTFTLEFSAAQRRIPPGVPPDKLPVIRDDQPALSTGLQEQLGLRLNSQRAPVPVIVIERAQLPTLD